MARRRGGSEAALPSASINALAAPGAEPGKKNKLENWADKVDSEAYAQAKKLYPLLVKGYQNKDEQDQRIREYWNIYNAIPDANQQYTGNSQGYVPAIRDAINARAKRSLKQLFPSNHRHVDGLSAEAEIPYTQLALLEFYIRQTKLRAIVRSDLIAGDVTGQWNLMVDWSKSVRSITKLVKRNATIGEVDGEDVSELGLENPAEEVEDTEEEDITEEGPEVVDFATEDLVVIPPTCDNLQKARAVSIRLRMSVGKVQEMVDEGVFILPEKSDIEAFCNDQDQNRKNPAKKQTNDAGIKTEGTDRHAEIFQCYAKLDLGGDTREEAIIFFAGQEQIVGIIKNPLWSGKRAVISAPIERLQGSFFGQSKIEPVKFLQWQLNDFWNMGQDSAMYSLLPIWAADPLKNPNWASMTMGLAAVWPIDPVGIKAITSPQLWKDAVAICDTMKRQIWESMDINEMMMGAMPAGRKNNQLMGSMSQEQSTNIIDHSTRYEEEMLNPLLEMLFEFDQQYRTADLMIETRGPIGVSAKVEAIPPQQWDQRFYFRWAGVEFTQSMQLMQQKIAWMNVLKGIPPQQLNGKTLDVTPILTGCTEEMFGPELAPKILIDKRNMYTVAAVVEDEMMHNGFLVDTHEADDDPAHLQAHMRAAAMNGDPLGIYKQHMGAHMMQLQRKKEMAMVQGGGGGMPGGPGGAGPGNQMPAPGVAGAPRPGAIPAQDGGRPMQNPPGAIQTDAMPGAMGRG